MQLAISKNTGRGITIIGEAGVGKSRLIHEFSTWLKTLPQEVLVLKGRTYQHLSQIPYTLVRDLISTFLGIQDNDPATVAEEKLIHGLYQFLAEEDEEEIRKHTLKLAELIGKIFSDYRNRTH